MHLLNQIRLTATVLLCLVAQTTVALHVAAAQPSRETWGDSQSIRQARQVLVLCRLNPGSQWSASSRNNRATPSLASPTLSGFPAFLFSELTFTQTAPPLSPERHRYSGRSPPVSL